MKVTIQELNKNLPAVEALLMEPHNMSFVDGDFDGEYGMIMEEAPDDIIIEIVCNGIIVNDDRISIEFPDGRIADYEICSDDYSYINII
jgi:hypothetical protein